MRKKLMLLGLSLFLVMPAFAQDASQAVENKTFYEDGSLKSKEFLIGETRVGVYKEYWPNQKMKQKAVYDLTGVLDGYVRYHDESGVVTKKEIYENGTLVSTTNYESGQPVE